jgi:hypothetical protein
MRRLNVLKSKTFLWFCLIIAVAGLSVFALIAWKDIGISAMWGDKKGVEIRPGPGNGASSLGSPTTVNEWKMRYDALWADYQKIEAELRAHRGGSIRIEDLPEGLRGTPTEAAMHIRHMWEYSGTIWYCCQVVATGIAQHLSIDTNGPADNDDMDHIYRCLQVCLRAAGFYHREINADWRVTNAAVLQLQRSKGLVIDGKVGRQTWHAILIELAKELYGRPASQPVQDQKNSGQPSR